MLFINVVFCTGTLQLNVCGPVYESLLDHVLVPKVPVEHQPISHL